MRIIVGAVLTAAGLAASAAHAQRTACDRACLEGFMDRYLDAVVANDPSAVPLAANLRYTENGQRLLVGDGVPILHAAHQRLEELVASFPGPT